MNDLAHYYPDFFDLYRAELKKANEARKQFKTMADLYQRITSFLSTTSHRPAVEVQADRVILRFTLEATQSVSSLAPLWDDIYNLAKGTTGEEPADFYWQSYNKAFAAGARFTSPEGLSQCVQIYIQIPVPEGCLDYRIDTIINREQHEYTSYQAMPRYQPIAAPEEFTDGQDPADIVPANGDIVPF